MATSRKTQAKAGIPEKRRGQQMGDERSKPSKIDEAQQQPPALRGRRKAESKFFADDSFQSVGTRGETKRDNTPSVPAAIPTGVRQGEESRGAQQQQEPEPVRAQGR